MFSIRSILLVLTFGLTIIKLQSWLRREKIIEGSLVTINQGKVQGKLSISRNGRHYNDFLGIPYAKPPIGELRFEPPKPPERWSGVLHAFDYGAKCLQLDLLENDYVGSESCLFLNVHVPNVKTLKLMPVLVFIHGGLFVFGSSNVYRPDYFMDEDIILVTLNYRLAALGFLNTGDGIVKGNMGLKDQVMALKWVKENIKSFGGDPNKVTIFGESAGAASVHYHLLSPMSSGLFSKAISQSGVALNPWALATNPADQAKRFAKVLKCHTDDTKKMVACLKGLCANKLVEGHREVQDPLRDPISVFVPTIESPVDENTFLGEHPEAIIAAGKIQNVPWITGVNSDEGLINSAILVRNETLLKHISSKWNEIIPKLLYLTENPQLADKVRDFYFESGNKMDKLNSFENLTKMFTDRFWLAGLKRTIQLQAKHNPIFLYYYSYTGDFSLANYLLALKGEYPTGLEIVFHLASTWVNKNLLLTSPPNYGVCHSDELFQLFRMPWMHGIMHNDKDYEMSKKFVKLWVGFAKDDIKNLKFSGTAWKPHNPEESILKFMELKKHPRGSVLDEPFTERLEFWKSLGDI